MARIQPATSARGNLDDRKSRRSWDGSVIRRRPPVSPCPSGGRTTTYFEPSRIADAIGVREPRDPSSRNSTAPCGAPSTSRSNPLHRRPVSRRRSPTERASRPGASHAAVPFSLLESRPRHIGTHPPLHRPCSGSRRVCSRWRKSTMKDKPAADRHASPTLGKFDGFFRWFSGTWGKADQISAGPPPLPPSASGFRRAAACLLWGLAAASADALQIDPGSLTLATGWTPSHHPSTGRGTRPQGPGEKRLIAQSARSEQTGAAVKPPEPSARSRTSAAKFPCQRRLYSCDWRPRTCRFRGLGELAPEKRCCLDGRAWASHPDHKFDSQRLRASRSECRRRCGPSHLPPGPDRQVWEKHPNGPPARLDRDEEPQPARQPSTPYAVNDEG